MNDFENKKKEIKHILERAARDIPGLDPSKVEIVEHADPKDLHKLQQMTRKDIQAEYGDIDDYNL